MISLTQDSLSPQPRFEAGISRIEVQLIKLKPPRSVRVLLVKLVKRLFYFFLFIHFMEPEGSLPCSQDPHIGPHTLRVFC
jgi:hypothetical protein